MELLGVVPGGPHVMGYRVPMHFRQAAGGSHAAAFRHMLQQRNQFGAGQFRTKQGRAFAFRKSCLASATIQQADGLVLAKPATDRQVSCVSPAVIHTLGVLTAKSR
jgi:hypothetical protein